ncbi:family 43 glycosylhydrolase [Paenibacillus sp. F411]|uniref:family 43 glycosylhydrolase n=1 Tax=Paenibacillus sp. F411 TaxID=2820239 RepID=UPI0032666977
MEHYMNPIIAGDYPDPSIVRVDQDYYMTHSSFQYAPGLLIWHSRNLVHWEPVGYALQEYLGDVWAPDFIEHHGMFYIYFPANGTNWVVTAPSPIGPWSRPIDLSVGHIDPGHIAAPDGKRYLHLSGGHFVELEADGCSVIGTPRKVYDGWPYPLEWRVEGFCLESPKLMYKDDYYYLTSAQGGTAGPATSHMVISARSRTPWGPWENSPYNPIVRTSSRSERWCSRGHGTLLDASDGTWWMLYHGYEKEFYTLGRQTLMEPIEWTSDGWFRVPGGIQPDQPLPLPSSASVDPSDHGMMLSDSFAESRLGLQWQRFGASIDDHRYELKDRSLTIHADEVELSPLLCIVPDHAYSIETEISLLDEGAEGLLLLFYDRACYTGIGLSKHGVFGIRRSRKLKPRICSANRVRLKLINDKHEVELYYKLEEEDWVKLPETMDTSGYHHNALGGFLSLRAGIEATGKGRVQFHDFTYRKL